MGKVKPAPYRGVLLLSRQPVLRRWHTYDGVEEKRDFEDLLREVERDPKGIFFG
jgi:hypothetical protein